MITATSLIRIKRLARAVFAAILLAGLAANVLPLETVAAGPACTLSCCAGRAPHAAGSCMNGSCRAGLRKASRQTLHSQNEGGEQLCGLSFSTRRLLPLVRTKESAPTRPAHESGPAQLASNTIEKPCLPECGSCAATSANSNRDRQIFAAGPGSQHSPTIDALQNVRASLSRSLLAKYRQSAPRGPPLAFS